MKTRNGFVSNSSSASFLVARPKELSPEVTIVTVLNLKEISQEVLKTKEDVDQYIVDTGYTDSNDKSLKMILKDPYFKKLYKQMIEAIECGDWIYTIELDNSDKECDYIVNGQLRNCRLLSSDGI